MRQANNKVYIEGVLAENNLKNSSYVSKQTGANIECINGNIVIRVDTNGKIMDIPVSYFQNKFTKTGQPNKIYTSLASFMGKAISIAAGGEEAASKIRVIGELHMNEFFAQDGTFVSSPRITASFVNEVKGDLNPHADFETELYINSITDATDAEGIELDPPVVKVQGLLAQYGDKVDVVEFVAKNPDVINAIGDMWNPMDTVPVRGKLNFVTEVVKASRAATTASFGEPLEYNKTSTIHEFVITGGNAPYDNDMAFDRNEMNMAVANRKRYLQALKDKPAKKPAAPAPISSFGAMDLGF